MKTIELSKFEKSNESKPYTIYFVYPKDGEPTVVKGMSGLVKDYVAKNFSTALIHYTFWKKGKQRGGWHFQSKDNVLRSVTRIQDKSCLKSPYYKNYRRGFNVSIGNERYHFRRMPKKWIENFS